MGNCPIHGVPFVHKSGVSKSTGKPYDFWGCSERNADGSYCSEKPGKASEATTARPSANGNGNKTSREIARMNALTNAVNTLKDKEEASSGKVLTLAEQYYNWITKEETSDVVDF